MICDKILVQRQRHKQLYKAIDPIVADISKLIMSGKFTPTIRKQLQAQLESLGGYVRNQKRKAGL